MVYWGVFEAKQKEIMSPFSHTFLSLLMCHKFLYQQFPLLGFGCDFGEKGNVWRNVLSLILFGFCDWRGAALSDSGFWRWLCG